MAQERVVDSAWHFGEANDMEQQELKELVSDVVREAAAHSGGETRYRSPIVGFSGIDDEEFTRLQTLVPGHVSPEELLPGARGLVSDVRPFAEDVVRANARSEYIAREWAVAYVETNQLLSTIAERLVLSLTEHGARGAAEAPTYVFDRKTLMARWSHKSIAYMTGIGSFGLNRLLITDAGCAGRFGSLVVDVDLGMPTETRVERCLYYHNGSCGACVKRCPIAALGNDGSFDRAACYQRLLEADDWFSDLPITDVCGQCAVGLPCSRRNPVSAK